MLIAIIGGKLQGAEAAYLARKAGWDVMLIDRQTDAPATGLCNRHIPFNVVSAKETSQILAEADLILPALENRDALNTLIKCADITGIPLAFDADAYAVTASKIRSDRLFTRLKLAAPAIWPECGFPVIVKPDGASGSRGVRVIRSKKALLPYTNNVTKYVIQEFLPGNSYSMEVFGFPGHYHVGQVTGLETDAGFDCKRVLAPAGLNRKLTLEFERMSVIIAESLHLKGLADVEVILDGEKLKLLEIDARLPSQTPTAVYQSVGINLVKILGELFINPGIETAPILPEKPRAVIYEHIRVSGERIEVAGEHIMSGSGPLSVHSDFFGADEAVTNYKPGCDCWVATLIFTEKNMRDAYAKKAETIDAIMKHCGCDKYTDTVPEIQTERINYDPSQNG